MASEEARQQVLEIIHQLNDSWATGHPENLAGFFSEDIVMVPPNFRQRTEGRKACVSSYVDFCNQAVIGNLTLGEISVDVFGDTAVATYSYEISYEMGGESFNDKGRDIFVFTRDNDRWQAVWRTMIVSQPEVVN